MNPQGGVASEVARLNVGIDVSKQFLDACWGTREQRFGNDAPGWDGLITKLRQADVDLVVIEATGGYERGLLCALQGAGIDVARVNPRQTRDFAKSMGVLAKTDRVDARVLRDFADVVARHKERHKYITLTSTPEREQLAAMMVRRRQLVDMQVAEHNRLDLANARAARSIRSVLKTLEKQLADMDRDVDDHLNRHFKQQSKLLDSVKGVGPVTILTLTSCLPELGRLAGVHPAMDYLYARNRAVAAGRGRWAPTHATALSAQRKVTKNGTKDRISPPKFRLLPLIPETAKRRRHSAVNLPAQYQRII